MSKNARLNGCLDEIELGFVEREATPPPSMALGSQLYLVELSTSNTILIVYISGVERVRSTVHSRGHKAGLQPESGRCLDHVAVDETVIQLNDERYWLYAVLRNAMRFWWAAQEPCSRERCRFETDELLHTTLETTRANVLAHAYFAEPREKHDVETAVFPSTALHR